MPSPFPGMNPYLEQDDVWRDFHDSFLPAAREFLSPQVTPTYFVKVQENIYLHERDADERRLLGLGDVSLSRNQVSDVTTGSLAVAKAPRQVLLPRVDVETETFLEIRDKARRQLVTVIELLSPTNKRHGEDREQYLNKRARLLRSEVNFVEIDLLRGLDRMPFAEGPESDYCVLVSRAIQRPHADFWPIGLREPLPVIPIPLQPPHPDARLDLQAVLHRVYDAAYYGDYIYTDQPQPRLSKDDAAWAATLVPASS